MSASLLVDLRYASEEGKKAADRADATFQSSRINAAEARRLGTVQESEHLAKEPRAERLAELVHSFETTVGNTVNTLASGATQLEMTSHSMTNSAGQTRQQAASVTAAADEAGASLQTVAAAAEQLTSSIVEIGRQITRSTRITQRAVA